MKGIVIEKASLEDLLPLQQISRRTFLETFATVNTEENMSKYLQESFSIEKLTGELTDKNSQFFLARRYIEVVGYLKVNLADSQTELKESRALEIERIYVLKEFHGQQLGQLLLEKAIQTAKNAGCDYIWLGVWEENPRAIRFYEKNGFVPFDKHIFKLGDDEQTDVMMKLDLTGKK